MRTRIRALNLEKISFLAMVIGHILVGIYAAWKVHPVPAALITLIGIILGCMVLHNCQRRSWGRALIFGGLWLLMITACVLCL